MSPSTALPPRVTTGAKPEPEPVLKHIEAGVDGRVRQQAVGEVKEFDEAGIAQAFGGPA